MRSQARSISMRSALLSRWVMANSNCKLITGSSRGRRDLQGLRRWRRAADDQVAGLLSNHDDRRIGVAANDGRKNGGVRDAQVFQADDLQSRVDHRGSIVAHAAGSDRMMDGIGLCANVSRKFGVACGGTTGSGLVGPVPREGGRREYPAHQAYAVDQRRQILRRRQQIRVDQRRSERVGARQSYAAATAWIEADRTDRKTVTQRIRERWTRSLGWLEHEL